MTGDKEAPAAQTSPTKKSISTATAKPITNTTTTSSADTIVAEDSAPTTPAGTPAAVEYPDEPKISAERHIFDPTVPKKGRQRVCYVCKDSFKTGEIKYYR